MPAREALTHEGLQKYLTGLFGPDSKAPNGKSRGYLMLDYHWQSSMGDFKFDINDFPNVKETFKMIKLVSKSQFQSCCHFLFFWPFLVKLDSNWC